MKAKDTVISWERIRMVFQEQDKKGTTDNMFIMEALCEAQAEQTESMLKEQWKQEGIKEVVEWAMKYYESRCVLMSEEGKTKLKDWGIK